MKPLGRFWESFRSFPRTLGRLLENVSKNMHKGAIFYQKSPKGDPKVEEGRSKTVSRTPPGGLISTVRFDFFLQKEAKTGVENHDRFCPSSIAPATLLEVRGNSLKNQNMAKV